MQGDPGVGIADHVRFGHQRQLLEAIEAGQLHRVALVPGTVESILAEHLFKQSVQSLQLKTLKCLAIPSLNIRSKASPVEWVYGVCHAFGKGSQFRFVVHRRCLASAPLDGTISESTPLPHGNRIPIVGECVLKTQDYPHNLVPNR